MKKLFIIFISVLFIVSCKSPVEDPTVFDDEKETEIIDTTTSATEETTDEEVVTTTEETTDEEEVITTPTTNPDNKDDEEGGEDDPILDPTPVIKNCSVTVTVYNVDGTSINNYVNNSYSIKAGNNLEISVPVLANIEHTNDILNVDYIEDANEEISISYEGYSATVKTVLKKFYKVTETHKYTRMFKCWSINGIEYDVNSDGNIIYKNITDNCHIEIYAIYNSSETDILVERKNFKLVNREIRTDSYTYKNYLHHDFVKDLTKRSTESEVELWVNTNVGENKRYIIDESNYSSKGIVGHSSIGYFLNADLVETLPRNEWILDSTSQCLEF